MSDTGAWMPWYVGDYLRDTAHLDTHEHGAYLLLLAHAWQHDGAIPLDHERLRRITKLSQDQWVRSESVILEFWQRNGSSYRQKRIDSELRRAKAKYDQRVNAGKSRAYKRALSERSADVERTVSESQPPSPSEPTPPSTPEAAAPALNPKGRKVKNTTRSASAFIRPNDCNQQVWDDWLEVRSKKKLPNTATAWKGIEREAGIAGISPATAIKCAAERGWGGFKAHWLDDKSARSKTSGNRQALEEFAEKMRAEDAISNHYEKDITP